jgi:mannose-6-phosphate isomerase-like protein (cupin superfamily)
MAVLAAALALGWASRERALAREKRALVQSQTVTLDRVETADVSFRDEVVGRVGFYVEGDTPASTKFVTGRFTLKPGKTNHLPHTHVEEEVLIVESGRGEIFCDGTTTPVGPGSVMYTTPNVPHGITADGETPLTFYFISGPARRRPPQ